MWRTIVKGDSLGVNAHLPHTHPQSAQSPKRFCSSIKIAQCPNTQFRACRSAASIRHSACSQFNNLHFIRGDCRYTVVIFALFFTRSQSVLSEMQRSLFSTVHWFRTVCVVIIRPTHDCRLYYTAVFFIVVLSVPIDRTHALIMVSAYCQRRSQIRTSHIFAF